MTNKTPALLGVGVGVGAFSGIFGVGGGILLVPYLALKQGLSQKVAQASSLVLVAMAAAAGVVTYAINASVAWLFAPWLIVGGFAGAWFGSAVVHRTPDARLKKAFAVLLVVVSLRLLLPTNSTVDSQAEVSSLTVQLVAVLLLSGLVMGILSALFGIGGGIILIPILVAVFSFTPQLAAGTSLAVMAPIALLGALRQRQSTDWKIGSITGLGAVVGAPLGAWAALALPVDVVRIGFAVVLIFVAFQMLRSARRS